ncbi:MAG: hypothetical protein A2017_09040 [Lentisphaerae bacterium GWF2_44_16]|nr:MAG: hypothetical protein A2017_09040 [Lentisphaerae bacterium GWF2_44_16]
MSYKIIPSLKKVEIQKGTFKIGGKFHLSSSVKINFIPDEIKKLLKSQDILSGVKGFHAVISQKKISSLSSKYPVAKFKNDEHYFIKITSDKILVSAASEVGLIRAFATLQNMIRQNGKSLNCCEIEDWPDLKLRGAMQCLHNMHDFMALPGPNLNGLNVILDRMFEAKLNCLLIEYEAMYPWSGKHSVISCKDAFTEKEVKSIVKKAGERGIEIIPLVQTLGHVYHLLIHKEYKYCEESPEHPQQLCPLKEASFKLACELIDDTMRLHPESRYIHLGGDECRQLGVCPECAAFAAKHGKYMLHAQFYKRLTDYVVSKGLTPIIWHDIAIKAPEALRDFNEKVVFHFWNYGDISHGPMDAKLDLLKEKTGSGRILGGSAARGEAAHGAVLASMRIIQSNTMEMNRRMHEEGCIGSIITDWPGSGIPFFNSIPGFFMQGDFSWNATKQNPVQFRKNYALSCFGEEIPELAEMQDAIYGCTPFAKSFTTQLKHRLNRYVYRPYDFKENLKEFEESKSTSGLYQLFHKRLVNIELVARLEELQRKGLCGNPETDAQIISAKINLAFTSLALGLAATEGPYPGLAAEDLEYYLKNEKILRKEFIRIYGPYMAKRHLKNYLDMLFKPEIRKGTEELLKKLKAL